MDSLKAAVENGADAVYMGGKAFNARRNAANFGDDELKEAIGYAHARGVSIYITMNTLVSDAEMQEAMAEAGRMYEAGADALIVQDLGFASLLRKHIPDFSLHMSTQGTVYSAEGIRVLAPLGFSRFILARELTLAEIGRIAKESPAPVEVFAHGALCVCYSGQCLMSSMIGCRSGNRGLCAQPCRLPYRLGGASGYLLSPKDICTLELLPELVSAGVAALKIEGRMKSPEYVAAVTQAYRKYLDLCASGEEYRVDGADVRDLLLAFDRGGFTTGYLKGALGAALIAREKPKPPDDARRAAERALEARVRASFKGASKRKIRIRGSFMARAGEKLRFDAWDGEGHRAEAQSAQRAEEARTQPLGADAARAQLVKAGGTPFEFADCAVEVDGQVAAKLSELNALRREALAVLEAQRAAKYPERHAAGWKAPPAPTARAAKALFSLFLYRWREELSGVLHLADRVYLPFTDLTENRVRLERRPAELMAWLPPVTNGQLDERIRQKAGMLQELGLDGVLIGNAAHIELLRNCGLPLYGDATLNAFNGWTLGAYETLGLKSVALSHELTMAQIAALPDCGIEKEAAVYGRLPLMHSAHCPIGAEIARSAGGKPCGLCMKSENYELIDRMDARFPLLCDATGCRCTILNADILFVPQLAARLAGAGVSMLRMYVSCETPGEIENLLRLYREALAGGAPAEPLKKGFTKGHYFRGV